MTTNIQPINFYVEKFKQELIADSQLTDDSDGSMIDILSGAIGISVNELQEYLVAELKKTYFDSATGTDLDALAFDHFGFSREAGQSDEDFRVAIRSGVEGLASGTKGALDAAIRTVSQVEFVSFVENTPLVVEYNDLNGQPLPGARPFRINIPNVYVAGENGAVIDDLSDVIKKVEETKACGSNIKIFSATTKPIDIKATLTFTASVSSEADKNQVFQNVVETITNFLNQNLKIGDDYVQSDLQSELLTIYRDNRGEVSAIAIDRATATTGDHEKVTAGDITAVEASS